MAGILVTALIALALALMFWPTSNENPVQQAAAEIAKNCAGGRHIENSSSVEAGLRRYLNKVAANTKISSVEVGIVTSKLTSDNVGLEFYKAYAQCLKDGTESHLKLKGVLIIADRVPRVGGSQMTGSASTQSFEETARDHRRQVPNAKNAESESVADSNPAKEAVPGGIATSINQTGGINAAQIGSVTFESGQ